MMSSDFLQTQLMQSPPFCEEEVQSSCVSKACILKRISSLDNCQSEFYLPPGIHQVGRSANHCHVHIPHESVSAKHACIEVERNGGFFVFDCGSRNGTWRNKVKLKTDVRYELEDNDEILFGQAKFQFFKVYDNHDGCEDESVANTLENDSLPMINKFPLLANDENKSDKTSISSDSDEDVLVSSQHALEKTEPICESIQITEKMELDSLSNNLSSSIFCEDSLKECSSVISDVVSVIRDCTDMLANESDKCSSPNLIFDLESLSNTKTDVTLDSNMSDTKSNRHSLSLNFPESACVKTRTYAVQAEHSASFDVITAKPESSPLKEKESKSEYLVENHLNTESQAICDVSMFEDNEQMIEEPHHHDAISGNDSDSMMQMLTQPVEKICTIDAFCSNVPERRSSTELALTQITEDYDDNFHLAIGNDYELENVHSKIQDSRCENNVEIDRNEVSVYDSKPGSNLELHSHNNVGDDNTRLTENEYNYEFYVQETQRLDVYDENKSNNSENVKVSFSRPIEICEDENFVFTCTEMKSDSNEVFHFPNLKSSSLLAKDNNKEKEETVELNGKKVTLNDSENQSNELMQTSGNNEVICLPCTNKFIDCDSLFSNSDENQNDLNEKRVVTCHAQEIVEDIKNVAMDGETDVAEESDKSLSDSLFVKTRNPSMQLITSANSSDDLLSCSTALNSNEPSEEITTNVTSADKSTAVLGNLEIMLASDAKVSDRLMHCSSVLADNIGSEVLTTSCCGAAREQSEQAHYAVEDERIISKTHQSMVDNEGTSLCPVITSGKQKCNDMGSNEELHTKQELSSQHLFETFAGKMPLKTHKNLSANASIELKSSDDDSAGNSACEVPCLSLHKSGTNDTCESVSIPKKDDTECNNKFSPEINLVTNMTLPMTKTRLQVKMSQKKEANPSEMKVPQKSDYNDVKKCEEMNDKSRKRKFFSKAESEKANSLKTERTKNFNEENEPLVKRTKCAKNVAAEHLHVEGRSACKTEKKSISLGSTFPEDKFLHVSKSTKEKQIVNGKKRSSTKVSESLSANKTNKRKASATVYEPCVSKKKRVTRKMAKDLMNEQTDTCEMDGKVEQVSATNKALESKNKRVVRFESGWNEESEVSPPLTATLEKSKQSKRPITNKKTEVHVENTVQVRRSKRILDAKKKNTVEVAALMTDRKKNLKRKECFLMCTGIALTDDQMKTLEEKLNVVIITDLNDIQRVTHLVAYKARRTIKFLCALARGIHIYNVNWLWDSLTAGKLMPSRDPYLLFDPEVEQKYHFSLKESVSLARSTPLFKDYIIHVTPSVEPDVNSCRLIVQCAGGKYLDVLPKKNFPPNLLVISCPSDLHLCKHLQKENVKILSIEFILTGLLRQKVEIDLHRLVVDLPSTKTKPKRNR